MATALRPAKAKAAQRVIEVLEFFDEQHRRATVTDIARHYSRPQSSTSELLASLVDLGLLYKDPVSRSYTLTPRAAIIGSLSQPRLVQDGRLAHLIETLHEDTGLGVVLIGMVGPNAQIFRCTPDLQRLCASAGRGFAGGAQDRLQATAAGWLLLSTLAQPRRDGLVRRLNAEAPDDQKFNYPEMSARIKDCARWGSAAGPAGFGAAASMAAILLAHEPDDHPMVLGLVHEPCREIDPARLVSVLQEAAGRCLDVSRGPQMMLNVANAA